VNEVPMGPFRILTRGERNAVEHLARGAVQQPQQSILAGQRHDRALLAADRGGED
jgi:hypothetical protein